MPAETDDILVVHADEDLGGLGGALVKGAADAVYLGLDGLLLLGNLGVSGFEPGQFIVESLQVGSPPADAVSPARFPDFAAVMRFRIPWL